MLLLIETESKGWNALFGCCGNMSEMSKSGPDWGVHRNTRAAPAAKPGCSGGEAVIRVLQRKGCCVSLIPVCCSHHFVSRMILLVDPDDILGLSQGIDLVRRVFSFSISLRFSLGRLKKQKQKQKQKQKNPKNSYKECLHRSSCLLWTCILEEATQLQMAVNLFT